MDCQLMNSNSVCRITAFNKEETRKVTRIPLVTILPNILTEGYFRHFICLNRLAPMRISLLRLLQQLLTAATASSASHLNHVASNQSYPFFLTLRVHCNLQHSLPSRFFSLLS